MMLTGLFTRRVRGFRVYDIAALAIALTLALTDYAFKTFAGAAERASIDSVETQIHDETRQVRLLRAATAHLESPDRLEKLATQWAQQAPINAKQEVTPDGLSKLAVTRAEAPPAAPAAANAIAPAANANSAIQEAAQ
jgi:hypothetical protein